MSLYREPLHEYDAKLSYFVIDYIPTWAAYSFF